MDKNLETAITFSDNVIMRLKRMKTKKNEEEIDILYFLRGICRELQHHTRKDKKMSKGFANRAKVFQTLMTLKRKVK